MINNGYYFCITNIVRCLADITEIDERHLFTGNVTDLLGSVETETIKDHF